MKMVTRSLFTLFLLFAAASASAEGLVDLLTSQLGVTSEQASGGAGSMFSLAKDNLSEDDFSQIASVVPGIDKMISSVPTTSKESGGVAAVASMLGGDNSSTGNLAKLASSFGNLDMDSGMVGKFMPIILDYLQSAGGSTVMELMKGALSL